MNRVKQKIREYNILAEEVPQGIFIFLGIISLVYFGFFTFLSFRYAIPLPPEIVLVFLLLVLYLYPKTPAFLKILPLPLLSLLFAYRFASAIAGEAIQIHVEDIIEYEQKFLPFIPTIKLQASLFTPGDYSWYDGFAAVVYFMQLPLPLIVGVYLFLAKKMESVQKFLISFFLLSYVGYITYLVFPAMPPWLASQNGHIPPVSRILLDFYNSVGLGFVNMIYGAVNHHPTAAVPSLHMATTFLPMIYIAKLYGRKGKLLALVVNLAVLFAIVYLGEHYFFDALVGVVYALLAYFLGEAVFYSIREMRERKVFARIRRR